MTPLSTWTPAELRAELDRIDRKRGPLSGATMMRRNTVANELRSRPEPRQPISISMVSAQRMRDEIAARKAAGR